MFAVIASAVAATPARTLPMPQSSYENIKVLTDMPDRDILNLMKDWQEALGVTCTYCHVSGDFASDMNPTKETARKMARMVKTINKDFLDGKAKCILCHRGSAVPNL
jgi:photosynthetic reaction center cytochrome c subunit